mmetsp:Transcript_32022/g.75069  ORF Transcript_32022/g.75069 Transcript_32022/m.75069 type:complete len:329 (-) Transcript_32022:50-1036(-)
MHLILIRHGQSANNILEAEHGSGDDFNKRRSHDPPLSALGRQQAELLGRRLGAQLCGSRRSIRLFCSSMTRALQTVEPLAKELGIQPIVHPDVHEAKGFYDTTGKLVTGPSRSAIRDRFPGFDVALLPEGGQGAETCKEALQRAQRMAALLRKWSLPSGDTCEGDMKAMCAEADGSQEIVIIVSHCDFMGLLTRALLMPSADDPKGELLKPVELFQESYLWCNNTGVSHFVLGASPPPGSYPVSAHLLYWNRTDHLPEAMRSGVNFKSLSAQDAAVWARVGDGGTGALPVFDERKVVHPHSSLRAQVILVATTAVAVAALTSWAHRFR